MRAQLSHERSTIPLYGTLLLTKRSPQGHGKIARSAWWKMRESRLHQWQTSRDLSAY